MTMPGSTAIKEVLEFVRENDVKFVRLAFCDLFGVQKNISIMPGELSRAFTDGVSFDASAIRGFSDVNKSDLLLFPDPSTLNVLPWRSVQGRVVRFYCDIKNPDGSDFEGDSRAQLKSAVRRGEEMGYRIKIGTECEFYLFKTDEDGEPTGQTMDHGGYFDISPLDKGENIRREICLCLEEMGISPETSHHEQGPGQNEIDCRPGDPLASADNLLTFKSVVKAISARSGLFASFMPKPLPAYSGNGMHVNLSLSRLPSPGTVTLPTENLFATPSPEAEQFMAGVLERTPEMTLFFNPTANSYERLGRMEAPQYVSWSKQNRSQLIRIPAATGDKARMELRSPDPSVNPYLAFAALLHAGLDGIQQQRKLPPPLDVNLYTADIHLLSDLTALPASLSEALVLARKSDFLRRAVGGAILDKYLAAKEQEADAFRSAADKEEFYRQRYFKTL